MLNEQAVSALFAAAKDDGAALDFIERSLLEFEKYHRSVYEMEIKLKLYPMEHIGRDAYQANFDAVDRMRTATHNSIIGSVAALNRLAERYGVGLVYDGVISEERPYRRELANAVFEYIEFIINHRR